MGSSQKGFLVHELDIDMTELLCQLMTGFEEHGQEDVASLQHETHAKVGSQDLCLDGSVHAVNVG